MELRGCRSCWLLGLSISINTCVSVSVDIDPGSQDRASLTINLAERLCHRTQFVVFLGNAVGFAEPAICAAWYSLLREYVRTPAANSRHLRVDVLNLYIGYM